MDQVVFGAAAGGDAAGDRAPARAIRRGPAASEPRTEAPPRRWWASRHIGQVGRAIAFVGDYNTSR
jgi:hypothetical protein